MLNDKEQSLNQIINFRIDKLEKIKKMGINPFPYDFEVTHFSKEIKEKFKQLDDKDVSISGRIISLRRMGKASFFNVQDKNSKIQIYIKKDLIGENSYELFKLLDIGDIVGINGKVFKTKTKEVSIKCFKILLLSKSIRPLPGNKEKDGEIFHAFTDKEQRYRHRYLDLIVNPEIKDDFTKRSKIISSLRNYLDKNNFLEVETPVLQPLYGGASAKPFRTKHNALNQNLFLRISDELYLKRLISGGFDSVYEISKVFRNEGMDKNHNPEFTMLEFYKANVDYFYLMNFVEDLIRDISNSINIKEIKVSNKTIDLNKPFSKFNYMDLLDDALKKKVINLKLEELISICQNLKINLDKKPTLGRIYDVLMRELVEPKLIEPTFVLNYPKIISPLAKISRDGNENIVERFELFVGGDEIANAFSELNDPIDQRNRFEEQVKLQKLGDDEAHNLDEDFLQSMEIGMPPTGGVGIGVDRLVMLLLNKKNIKDVILFPSMRFEE